MFATHFQMFQKPLHTYGFVCDVYVCGYTHTYMCAHTHSKKVNVAKC